MAVPSTERIEAVVFDLGGVLFENIQEFFLPDLARRHELDPQALLALGYRHGAAWGLGRATEHDYWRGILTDAGLSHDLLPDLLAETSAYIRPIRESWKLVRALPPSLRLGILSNTTREWVQRLRSVEDWTGRFDPVLLSYEIGLCKPDPAIFELLLQRLNLPGSHVLFVDDREDNLDAAAALGIQGHLYLTTPDLRRDLTALGVLQPQSIPFPRRGAS
jgi:putative hydrolase of the HAD superfamily